MSGRSKIDDSGRREDSSHLPQGSDLQLALEARQPGALGPAGSCAGRAAARWRAVPSCLAVVETLGLGEREGIRRRLGRRPVADLPAADVGRDLLREACGIEHAESRAPGVSEDRDLLSCSSTFAHGIDQLVEVGDELLHGHGGSGNPAVERLAAAALVPVDDREGLLERRVEVTEERRLGQPGPPCSRINGRIGETLAANHHPLIDPAQAENLTSAMLPGTTSPFVPRKGRVFPGCFIRSFGGIGDRRRAPSNPTVERDLRAGRRGLRATRKVASSSPTGRA